MGEILGEFENEFDGEFLVSFWWVFGEFKSEFDSEGKIMTTVQATTGEACLVGEFFGEFET